MADSVNNADDSIVSDFDTSLRDVELLSDEELYTRLKTTGKEVGPVVDTTRKLYQKQLATLMSTPNSSYYSQGNSSINSNVTNGSTENGFSDSEDDATFETSSRTSRSSRSSSTTKSKKGSDILFTPRLRPTKEAEAESVKKNLESEEFTTRRESTRPTKSFEDYVKESEAKKKLYGDKYLRKDLLSSDSQQQVGGINEQTTPVAGSSPLWQQLLALVLLLAIFGVIYYSLTEKKLDQNEVIDKEIEELTKQEL